MHLLGVQGWCCCGFSGGAVSAVPVASFALMPNVCNRVPRLIQRVFGFVPVSYIYRTSIVSLHVYRPASKLPKQSNSGYVNNEPSASATQSIVLCDGLEI